MAAGDEVEAGIGAVAGVEVWETGAADSDFGASGTVVIALSGLSR